MSAHRVLAGGVATALAQAPGLAGVAVFDAPPERAARPFAVVAEPQLAEWGLKEIAGCEARLSVLIEDGGPSPARLRGLAGEAEAAMAALPRRLGEGWRWASLVMVRSRILRAGEGRWTAILDWRVRMLREDA